MTRLLATVALFAPAPLSAADSPIPVGGVGIVSADQQTVFVSAKTGGVEALDLATGKIMWKNKDAGRLAGASDNRVFGWTAREKKASTFRVVAVDAASGKTVGTSDPIEMPEWATTQKVGGRTFRTAVRADGAGTVVAWRAGAFYFGGAAPTEEILAAAKKDAGAVVSVDFTTGKVTVTKTEPKDDDFNGAPDGEFNTKAGGYEFQVEEEIPRFKPGAPMVTKVTLIVSKDKKELWARDLAGTPWNPPPP